MATATRAVERGEGMSEHNENEHEEKTFTLTPYGVLLSVMADYGISVSHITPRMAEHLFEDYMEALMRCGYVERKEQNNE